MDTLDLILGAKVKWVGDRIGVLADLAPRHIGRVATFDFFLTDNADDYSSNPVIGTFGGRAGDDVLVGGEWYPWSRISDLRIFRSEIA